MESVLENLTFPSSFQVMLLNILRFIVFLPVLYVLFQMYWRRRNLWKMMEQLPTSKIRIINPLGHMSFLFNHYIFKYPAPLYAYPSILMSGLTKVYGKNGIYALWQVSHPTVLFYKAEAVEMILSHSTEIKKSWFYDFTHPWLGEGLLTSDGQKWRQRRKLLTSAFHFNIQNDFLPVINKQSRILVNILGGHTQSKYVDIVTFITKCSFDIICETILGEEIRSQTNEDSNYQNSVAALTDTITDRVLKPWLWPNIVFYLTPTGRKQRYYIRKVNEFANKVIAKKKEEKLRRRAEEQQRKISGDDAIYARKKKALLDLLLDEHIENNSISLEDIREEVDTFTFEGHDTTSLGMSWALYLIGHHPDVQAKIHAELDSLFGDDDRDPTMDDLRELKYLECVIKESMRIYPPVPGFGRQLQQDLEINGQKVPKGFSCFIWAYSLHRDPDVFPNPEVFDPDRFSPENSAGRHPFAYVPFSAGPRNCIGQKFAFMEEKSVLSAIFRKYTVKSLQPRDQVHDTLVMVLRPYGGLKLEIRSRK